MQKRQRDKIFYPLTKVTRLKKDGKEYSDWFLMYSTDRIIKGRKERKSIKVESFNKDVPINQVRQRAIKLYNDTRNIESGLVVKTVHKTFKEGFDLWIDKLRLRNAASIEAYEKCYNLYLKSFGNKCIKDISVADIKNLHNKIGAKSKAQANRVLAIIQAPLNVCIEYEYLDLNPANAVKKFPEPKRQRYYSKQEKAQIFKHLSTTSNKTPRDIHAVCFLWLLLLTGARKGEISSIKWSDIKDNKIHLGIDRHKTGNKTGEKRIINLNRYALKVLSVLKTESKKNNYSHPAIRKRIKNNYVVGIASPRNLWDRVREECGLIDLRIHDLRHSFASESINTKQFNFKEVGIMLGHKSINSMDRYIHIFDQTTADNIEVAGDAILNKDKYINYLPQKVS